MRPGVHSREPPLCSCQEKPPDLHHALMASTPLTASPPSDLLARCLERLDLIGFLARVSGVVGQ